MCLKVVLTFTCVFICKTTTMQPEGPWLVPSRIVADFLAPNTRPKPPPPTTPGHTGALQCSSDITCERSKAWKGKLLHRKEVGIEEIKIYILHTSTLLVLFLQILFVDQLLGFSGCVSVWVNTSWSTPALSTFG